jgi:uncharacterized protein YaiL (DUF2058 family)
MSRSLQEQLLKAGLVDTDRLKAEKKVRHKKRKTSAKSKPVQDESRALADEAQRRKAEGARQANLERKRQAELRAVRAQIKEIVDRHRLDRTGCEVPYQFADRGKIKKIYVADDMVSRLADGRLGVVRLEGKYDVVPAAIAEKVAARDPKSVVLLNNGESETSVEDDFYADFQVPDDLNW